MTTDFVSRHPDAQDWAAQAGIRAALVRAHIDPTEVTAFRAERVARREARP